MRYIRERNSFESVAVGVLEGSECLGFEGKKSRDLDRKALLRRSKVDFLKDHK